MKRFIKWFLIIALVGIGIWYLAIKEEHYKISFTTKQPKALVYEHLLDKNTYANLSELQLETTAKKPFSNIQQQVTVGDSVFSYEWKIVKNEDQSTKVTAYIRDEKNPWSQKWQVPFSNNDFVQRSVKYVKEIGDAFAIKNKKFKVHSITDTTFVGGYCAYLPIKSSINRKAATMLYNISEIMGYIKENEIPLQGNPYLEVTEWNKETSSIKYNFCFPIAKSDSLPPTKQVLFKETPSMKALKAEFNGNYKDSDHAWYYLLEYAEANKLKVKSFPTEVFLNDPHSGGDALNWKAHIFLPLED